jgi:hypothetical protein
LSGITRNERLRNPQQQALQLANRLAEKIQDRRKPPKTERAAEARSRPLIREATAQHFYDRYNGVEIKMLAGGGFCITLAGNSNTGQSGRLGKLAVTTQLGEPPVCPNYLRIT